MGGHGHHEPPYTVPDYKIYQIKNVPELVACEKALACHGLKDPWLRNEVWRYNAKHWGTQASRTKALFLRGFRVGFAAFVVTIAGTEIWDRLSGSKDSHGHGHH